MSKMFLVEKSRFVVIRNSQDIDVSFSSFDDFYKYCPIAEFGVDLTGKTYIDYEPDRNLFIDSSNKSINKINIPVSEYENIINNIEVIKSRVNDPFYEMTLVESKEHKNEILEGELSYQFQTQFPIHEQLAYLHGIKSKDFGDEGSRYTSLINELNNLYTKLSTAKNNVVNAKTKDELRDIKLIPTGIEDER